VTDLERLLFLNIALAYRGQALGDDGYPDYGLGLLSAKEFDALEAERRQIIRKIAWAKK
jgi:hypothetical protein